ncbi:hypothetical protein [Natronosalvus caseinilyticus]|uniref:hypothetical protein n=1 Tax=Natronosalvus caseinilyticus TaxID=2953747 RepID=UPI0028B119AC|nr:hypothetical protein [Natronosalvus caseinilyticus]
MKRRSLLTGGLLLGISGCLGSIGSTSDPEIDWETKQGTGTGEGGDMVGFYHRGGDTLDLTEGTLEPGYTGDVDVRFVGFDHSTEKISNGDDIAVGTAATTPRSEFVKGEIVQLRWTAGDESESIVLAEHEWTPPSP